MSRARLAATVFLSVAGIFLSLLLLSKHYGVPLFGEAALAACGVDEGCDVVAQSRYSSAFGMPLAAWGLVFYGSLLALLLPAAFSRSPDQEAPDAAPTFGFFLVALAVVLDVILFGLQAFVIKAFCKFCMATYAVNLLSLGALWPARKRSVVDFLFAPNGRRGVLSWMVAVLAIGASAFATNAALADRKALARQSILGVPTMLQAPENPADPLVQARAEAKKWKDTLDNPQLLQDYLTQKAKDDFNHSKTVSIDLSRSPAMGSAKGPVVVVSFSDFMCPFCRELARGLGSFLKSPNAAASVKVHFKNYPLDAACNPSIGRTIHPGACELARAGICASDSGRFWEFHDQAFARPWETANREEVLKTGELAGLDRAKLGACMDNASTKGRLSADIDEAKRLGVGSTPTIFINGHELVSMNYFMLAMDEERKRLNLPSYVQTPPPPVK